jgi:hypothetical protein
MDRGQLLARQDAATAAEAVAPLCSFQERGSSSRGGKALLRPPCRLMDTGASTRDIAPAPQALSSDALGFVGVMFSPPT